MAKLRINGSLQPVFFDWIPSEVMSVYVWDLNRASGSMDLWYVLDGICVLLAMKSCSYRKKQKTTPSTVTKKPNQVKFTTLINKPTGCRI